MHRTGTDSNRSRWIAILAVVLIVQVLELLLLQRKYDLFTGGFLQPYSYLSLTDRLLFLGVSFWVDLFFFGAIGAAWFRLAERFHVRRPIAAYNFLFFSVAATGLWLAIKFKVLSYFNDTLNFLVIKNLGGGSLGEAFRYIADEAAMFGIALLLLILAYWTGYQIVRRRIAPDTQVPRHLSKPAFVWTAWLTVALVTIVLMAWINSVPELRYGLQKKTSYALLSRTLNTLSDIDRDGYGLFRFPTDNDHLDANVHPGALDIPNNGLDEDGYGGDFVWSGPEEDPLASLPPVPGKHILLIVLESARGDLIGKRWNGELVAPTMTRLAQEGTSVPFAYSHTGYTTSSLKAIFNRSLFNWSNRIKLADYLEKSGYSLSFLSGQDESFGDIAESTGMNAEGRYFFDARSALEDRVYPSKDPGSLRLSEARIVEQFRTRVDELEWDRPNFFYVNFQAAHFPYSHPKMPAVINERPIARSDISRENMQALQATYWNAIAVADAAIGELIELLRNKGVYKDTVILILGDHGESLFDDGFLGHGHALNEIQTRIPLIINRPGLSIEQAVGQVDVAQLLVEIATDRFDPSRWQDVEQAQFQLIGSLDTPQLVGQVSWDEIRTILDVRTRKVFFNDLESWRSFDAALKDESTEQRTRELIDQWESLRWEQHLARKKKWQKKTQPADTDNLAK